MGGGERHSLVGDEASGSEKVGKTVGIRRLSRLGSFGWYLIPGVKVGCLLVRASNIGKKLDSRKTERRQIVLAVLFHHHETFVLRIFRTRYIFIYIY